MLVFLTSSDARRYGQWENVSWWDFVGAETRSKEYQTVLAAGLTRNLVAAKETVASTRTIGHMGEAFVYNMMGQGNDGPIDRVLDLPTNEAWIDPWVTALRGRGALRRRAGLASYEVAGGKVSGLARGCRRQPDPPRVRLVRQCDAGRAARGPRRELRALDPALGRLDRLRTDWMAGIQNYLKKPVDLVRGHITFIDSPWALTALTQGQFWSERTFIDDYGDGVALDSLSVDISNWDAKGMLWPAGEGMLARRGRAGGARPDPLPPHRGRTARRGRHPLVVPRSRDRLGRQDREEQQRDSSPGEHRRLLERPARRTHGDPEPLPRRRLRANRRRPRHDGRRQ